VKVDQEGCALKDFAAFLRFTDSKLFPILPIHLHHPDGALDRARKARVEPPSGHEKIGIYY
jgi:hypothetical protein